MKKVITIVCLAAAPIIFAQEKAAKLSEAKQVNTEQVTKEQKKAQQVEANKKAEAEKANKKSKVVTTGPNDKTKKNSASSLNTEKKKK